MRNTPSEEVLWGYATQLAAVLRAAHSMGLALRPATLSATKVRTTHLVVCGFAFVSVPAAQTLLLLGWCSQQHCQQQHRSTRATCSQQAAAKAPPNLSAHAVHTTSYHITPAKWDHSKCPQTYLGGFC